MVPITRMTVNRSRGRRQGLKGTREGPCYATTSPRFSTRASFPSTAKTWPCQSRPAVRAAVAAGDVADEAGTEARLTALADELGVKRGQLFMPVRGALSGRAATPPLFAMMRVLGQEVCLARLDAAIAWLAEHGEATAD